MRVMVRECPGSFRLANVPDPALRTTEVNCCGIYREAVDRVRRPGDQMAHPAVMTGAGPP
jgi:hypothetical protein